MVFESVIAFESVAGYMTGGPTELIFPTPKKYMKNTFYTQKNTWRQNFLPEKYNT